MITLAQLDAITDAVGDRWHCLVEMGAIVALDQGLTEQDLDQSRIGRELGGMAQAEDEYTAFYNVAFRTKPIHPTDLIELVKSKLESH